MDRSTLIMGSWVFLARVISDTDEVETIAGTPIFKWSSTLLSSGKITLQFGKK